MMEAFETFSSCLYPVGFRATNLSPSLHIHIFIWLLGGKNVTLPSPTQQILQAMTKKYDFLVIGSGIAGMSFALKVAKYGSVALICKTTLDEANTALAQGGVASVTNLEVDDFQKHIHDTMVAGDYLSDPVAVEKVVTEAPAQIRQLIEWGVNFDKKEDGSFDLHRGISHPPPRRQHRL